MNKFQLAIRTTAAAFLAVLLIGIAAAKPAAAKDEKGTLYFTFVSSAYYMEKKWGHGMPLDGIKRTAEIAHRDGVPVTWLVNPKSAEEGKKLFKEYHDKYGDAVGYILTGNEATQKQSVSIAAQLYGESMVYDNGDPVPVGKRLTTTLFVPLDTPEKKALSERKLKNLYLALNNVPLDKQETAVYASWPSSRKLGLLMPSEEKNRPFPLWSFHGLQPTERWAGTKVLVRVTVGKDMDGNPRNEFTLLAASTKQAERKAR